jgi:Carboxypeptidase regulatory-like domain
LKNKLPWLIASAAVAVMIIVLVKDRTSRPPDTTAITANPATVVSSPVQVAVNPSQGTSPAASLPAGTPGTAAPTEQPTVPGHVFAGKVTDAAGKPIAGATITMFFNVARNQEKMTAQTDSSGSFRARGIKWDEMDILLIDARGFSSFKSTMPVPLPLPDPLEVTLQRLGATELRVLVARGDAAPVPFSGEATISVLKRHDAPTTLSTGAPVDSRYTALFTEPATIADGRYSVQDLQPGVYKAAALTKDEFAESDPFTVETSGSPEVTIVLGVQRAFAALVKSARTQAPVAGARVHMINSGRPLPLGRAQQVSAETGADGGFQFERMTPGTYSLTISASGFTTKTVEELAVSASQQQPAPETFFLSEGQPSLFVTVLEGTGKPVNQAPLVVFSSDNSAQPRSYFSRTDAAGTARFESIVSGQYVVAATLPDNRSRQKSSEIQVLEGQPQTVEIRFGPTSKVTGTARVGGKPFSGLVSFQPRGQMGPAHYARTDESGMFGTELEPGEYVAKRQGQTESTIVTVPNLETASLELELK